MQLAVCSVYALTLWLIRMNPITLLGLNAPSKQNPPDLKGSDLPKMGIVSFCTHLRTTAYWGTKFLKL